MTVEGAFRACKDKAQELTESEQKMKNIVERLLDEKMNVERRIANNADKAKYIISATRLEGTLGFKNSC